MASTAPLWDTGGTIGVNGTRFSLPTTNAFAPSNYMQPSTTVPFTGPSMPPTMMSGAAAPVLSGAGGMTEAVGGYGTAANNGTVTAIAGQNALNPKVGPIFWLLLFGLVGIFGLKWIMWPKGRNIESGSESVRVGKAEEAVKESV